MICAVVVALSACLWAVSAPAAMAHNSEIDSEPSADAVVKFPPSQVRVDFDGPLMDIGEALVVRAPDGSVVSAPAASVDGRSISTALRTDVPAGVYSVAYRVVSEDGHTVTSTFTYTVASGTAAASETASAPTSTGSTATAGVPPTAGTATPASVDAGARWLPVALTGLVAAGLAAALALVLRRGRKQAGR